MNNLKCPFCQKELEETMFARGRVFVSCNNPKCPIMDWGGCSKQIVTELILTRKELEVAVDALKKIKRSHNTESFYRATAELALEQITALEQKDVKCE